ncbi:hypothetical protein [Pararhodobacter sp.]|uniref:hypothetical protein n=1 Tax=Pararhodobacter sp. TaxID=2127056 RepID=UPI002FDDB767
MDAAWFKAQQKRAQQTTFDLGEAIGRDRSVVSKIVNGYQRMTLEQARIFAEKLDVPLHEMIEKAGLGSSSTARQIAPGFAESDVIQWDTPDRATDPALMIAKALGGDRAGVDVWRVKGVAMALGGLLPGDFMLVDTHAAERVAPGDVVIAQIYNRIDTSTVLRRLEPPVLVAASADPADGRVHVVDGVNVVVRGKVVASWRV